MKRLASHVFALLLAVLAGFAWTLVYPFAGFGPAGDALWLVLAVFFFGVLEASRGSMRSISVMAAAVSIVSALIALIWSAVVWRFGLAYPNVPPALHWLLHPDGEASYNADDGELFLVTLYVLLVAVHVFPRLRQFFGKGAG